MAVLWVVGIILMMEAVQTSGKLVNLHGATILAPEPQIILVNVNREIE
jgi:hypothetical protein